MQNLKTLYLYTFDGGIIWCYSEKSPFPSRQLDGTKNVPFNEVLPADFNNAKDKPSLNPVRFVKRSLFKGRM